LLEQIADRSKSRALTELARKLEPPFVEQTTSRTDDAAAGGQVHDRQP
jgi:hypothetical protein